MTIELSLFTNCTRSAPKIDIIKRTYESFEKTFGKIPMKIYIDKHPYDQEYSQYKENLKHIFQCEIIDVQSLSDGYIRSINESSADYLFQLEHDWIFLDNIYHSLEQIMEVMKTDKQYHFRFSKHENRIVPELMKWQTIMTEMECNGMKYVKTDNLSNNPHIIDRKFYKENMMNKIELSTGSKGIEENITKKGFVGCQYGGIGYPKTIQHLQGKKSQ